MYCGYLGVSNGKENGNYRDYRGYIGVILGLCWDNGKDNGNYYNGESNGKENGKENGK